MAFIVCRFRGIVGIATRGADKSPEAIADVELSRIHGERLAGQRQLATPNGNRESPVLDVADFVVGQPVIVPSRAALPPPAAVRSAPP